MRSLIFKKFHTVCRTVVVAALMISLIAGTLVMADPAYAASVTYKSPFDGSKYTINSRFKGNLIVNGVDVSYWQSESCDWKKAKSSGVDYAIMRVTYTNYGPKDLKLNPDSHFETNFKNAKAAGVMTGVYVFSQAKTKAEGKKEADYAVKRLKALGIGPEDLELPVYMDYEFAGGIFGRLHGIKKTAATNAAVAFCNRIKSYGYTPGIYANLTFFRDKLDTSRFAADVDLWCAQYNSSCGSAVNYTKWQYSSSAKINGILSTLTGKKGSTDVNFWFLKTAVSKNPLTVIRGKTTLSLSDAKNPKFTITEGSKTLKKGKDYIIGGIRNTAKGSGYIYIKGIGSYGGYALIPVTVADKSSGSADTDISGKCANYLTHADKSLSRYLPVTAKKIKYKKGKKYKVQENLNIRKGPGTNYSIVKRKKLSSSMKRKTLKGTYAVLKVGAKIKCKKVKGNWMKIPGGWVCCRSGSEIYVK